MIAGREGPTVQMGAALGQWISDLRRGRSPIDAHVLIAAGAGAGLTAAFNVPFAGILFVVEEMRPQFRYGVVSMQALIGACVVSDIVVRALLGTTPEIYMNVHPAPPLAALWLFVLLGAVFGVLGPLFNTGVGRLLDALARVPSPYAAAAVVGGLVGWLAWSEPLIVGEGYHVIGRALRGEVAVGALLLLFGVRYVGTILCFCAGSPGGVFAPLLALGTLLGTWFGEHAAEWLPALVPHPDVFAVAGMAALFAAVVRAPLTGIVLAVGLTSNYGLILPVIATCG
jgi:CIC family chloride channel protein